MVVLTVVLHDGLDVAVVGVQLLSVPFDDIEGYPLPVVTQATAMGCAAIPYTVHKIHNYIYKSEF